MAAFLPPGTTTRVASRGSFVDGRIIVSSDGSGAPQGFVAYDDGKGRAAVSVSVLDTDLRDLTCAQPTKPLFCDVLADGTVVKAFKSRLTSGQLSWSVSAMRPNGRRVEVGEFNTDVVPYDNPAATVTRAEPPLTIDQLQAIALSPHWDR